MLVMKENERLSPAAWEYNSCRITTHLAKIVDANGGRVKPQNSAIIINRTVIEAIKKLTKDIEEVKKTIAYYGENENRIAYLDKKQKELAKYLPLENEEFVTTHNGYISFIFNDFYYYYQTDNNPFFEFWYQKTPIINNEYSKDACLDESNKEWMTDSLFGCFCSEKEIEAAAQAIFEWLVSAKNSVIRRDFKRVRVPNNYNNRYHYETVYSPERKAKVDF